MKRLILILLFFFNCSNSTSPIIEENYSIIGIWELISINNVEIEHVSIWEFQEKILTQASTFNNGETEHHIYLYEETSESVLKIIHRTEGVLISTFTYSVTQNKLVLNDNIDTLNFERK